MQAPESAALPPCEDRFADTSRAQDRETASSTIWHARLDVARTSFAPSAAPAWDAASSVSAPAAPATPVTPSLADIIERGHASRIQEIERKRKEQEAARQRLIQSAAASVVRFAKQRVAHGLHPAGWRLARGACRRHRRILSVRVRPPRAPSKC